MLLSVAVYKNPFDVCVYSFQVDVIIGEPFFTSCLFPWHNLYFWYAAASAARVSKPAVKILPKGATLKAIAGGLMEITKRYWQKF